MLKPYCETMQNNALPNATKKWVRKPASFERYSRSMPMAPPSSMATTERKRISTIIGQWGYVMVFNFGIWGKGGLTFISFSLTMAKRGWPTGVVSARRLPTGASNSKCIILFCNLKYFCQEIAKTCQRTPCRVQTQHGPEAAVAAPRGGRACSQRRHEIIGQTLRMTMLSALCY